MISQIIFKNSILLFLSEIYGTILSILYYFFLIKYLSISEFGFFSYWLSLSIILSLISDLGYSQFIIRELARYKEKISAYSSSIFTIKIIFSAFSILTIWLISSIFFISKSETIISVIIISSFLIDSFNTKLFFPIFISQNKISFQALGRVIYSTLLFLGLIISIVLKFNLVKIALLHLFSNIIAFIYCFYIIISKFAVIKFRIDIDLMKSSLKKAFPFGITIIFVSSYQWIDSFFLKLFHGNDAVGWYNIGFRLVQPLLIISNIISLIVYPNMSVFFIKSIDLFKKTYQQHFRIVTILGISIAISVSIFLKEIILIIFGNSYMPVLTITRIFLLGIILIFYRSVFARLLESSDKQLVLEKISGLCVVISIFLNLMLTSKYGYIGAGVANLITLLINTLLYYCYAFFRTEYGKLSKSVIKDLLKTILIGLFISFLFFIFKNNVQFSHDNLLILMAMLSSSLLLFILLMLIFNVIKKDDINLITNTILSIFGKGKRKKNSL